MKEVRDFIISLLAEYDTFSICANCPNYNPPFDITACCIDCPHHDMEVGCILRNTSCLIWRCGALTAYLRRKGDLAEFEAMESLFSDMDAGRGAYRIPDHENIRLERCQWKKLGYRAVTASGPFHQVWERTWTTKESESARNKHRTFLYEKGEGT